MYTAGQRRVTSVSYLFAFLENCEVPSTSDGCAVAAAIIDLAERYGTIKVFKAYLETAQHATASPRSELASSGVDIIDCPHNGKKDVVDKMLMGVYRSDIHCLLV